MFQHPCRLVAAAALLLCNAVAHAVPGGEIGTLPTGRYQCEKPGDATGLIAVRVPDADFRVLASSSYAVNNVRGSYLLTGDDLVMTGGPFEGRRFVRTSVGYLRQLGPDGQPGEVRCVLTGRGTP
jgi:hypothetical protein